MATNERAVATRAGDLPAKRPETVADILLDQGRAMAELQARFPDDLKQPRAARQFLALCLTYDLDPLMGELVPFAGRPYITDGGWLKLIQKHAPGQLVRNESRLATDPERRELRLQEGDWMAIATVTRKWQNGETLTTTRRGLVRVAETKGTGHRPIEKEPWEMAEKRARVRALRTAFRDVLEVVTPRFGDDRREYAMDEDAPAELVPPPSPEPAKTIEANAKQAEKNARGEFFATAERLGLNTQLRVHETMILLGCAGKLHDDEADPRACHALREFIQELVKAGDTEDAAWERAKIRLEKNAALDKGQQELPEDGVQRAPAEEAP